MKKLHREKPKSWADAYYDGSLDPTCESFCEETQEIIKYEDDGWDDIEEAAIDMWRGKY